MLKAIFYARFHPERGPSVIHQYPPNSIIASGPADKQVLLNYSDISSYIIPPYEVCNQPLAICVTKFHILGYPVSLEDAKYSRNRYTFNVCFVLDASVDTRPWDAVVRKTANFFRAIEDEDGMLQSEEDLEGLKWAGENGYPTDDTGFVHGLLRATFQQLNAYGEACARVNDFHVLNLRLVDSKLPVPAARMWQVPLIIRALPSKEEWTWDLTLQRIYNHIDGVKHVQRIADDSDVELKLVKKAVQQLLYHERVILLDIFHFQAVYTATDDFAVFVKDDKMLDECCAYVFISPTDSFFRSNQTTNATHLTKDKVIQLYRHLSPGVSLQDFCTSHEPEMVNIDIRRFITFGVIKGFLRRIHKYALATVSGVSTPRLQLPSDSSTKSRSFEDSDVEIERAWKKAALSSGWPTPPVQTLTETVHNDVEVDEVDDGHRSEEDTRLAGFLDGKHCMDEICVSLRMTEKTVAQRLENGKFGNVALICR